MHALSRTESLNDVTEPGRRRSLRTRFTGLHSVCRSGEGGVVKESLRSVEEAAIKSHGHGGVLLIDSAANGKQEESKRRPEK